MASGGHVMLQEKPGLETKLKTLINDQLKDICRAYNYNVSGTKATLQKRCMEILDDIIRRGDVGAFEDLKYRAHNKGQPKPLDSAANSHNSPSAGYQPYSMAPGRPNVLPASNRLPTTRNYFKSSPFYEIVETVLPLQDLPDGPEMPQNRHTVRATINLNAEQCQKIANEGQRLLLYCGQSAGMNPYHTIDVAFPNQIEVKVNSDDVKSNFKGLKNKPGSTKPADVTDKFRTKPAGYDNQVTLTYALTTKRYSYVIYLVRHIKPDMLAARIKNQSVIPKQKVIDELNKANADPDIEAFSTRMSLKDPISTIRISLPVRSTVCTHMQCFDGSMFLQMMEQAPLWNCPICHKTVSFQSLCVDKYFEDILHNTPKSIEKVAVEPNGDWQVIKEEEDEQPNGGSSKLRASYDDDFDDDLVEVTEPTNKTVDGLKRESQPPQQQGRSPLPGAFSTPPLSSREPSVPQSAASANRTGNKRPSGAVIDLTLSDDEEEQPPRPAKRTQTAASRSQGNTNSSNSYNTPTSIPDRGQSDSVYPHAAPQISYPPPTTSFRQADNYRPSPSSNYAPRQQSLQPIDGSASGASNPHSPLRPAGPTFGAPGWGPQHSRPPSQASGHNGVSSFSLRPPPPPSGGAQSPATQQSQQSGGGSGLTLPPINQATGLGDPWGIWPRNSGGSEDARWRSSERSHHSSSPG